MSVKCVSTILRYFILKTFYITCICQQREKYFGERTTEKLVKYSLKQTHVSVIELTDANFKSTMRSEEGASLPWVITFCGDGGG